MQIEPGINAYRLKAQRAASASLQAEKPEKSSEPSESFVRGSVRGAICGGAAGAATAAFALGAVAVACAASGDPVPLNQFAWGLSRAAALAAPIGAAAGVMTGAVAGPTELSQQTKKNIAYATGAAGGLGAVGVLIYAGLNSI